jgi:hypothetical protein
MARRYATTAERGLGAEHVADKKRLLARHRDGDLCWRCGQPMYKTQALERDHVIDRALGGISGPAVLAHASCNRSAGGKLRHQLYPETSRRPAPPATCKTCGKTYTRPARACEICGIHYHPTYGAPGEQRTCSRACGVQLRRRNHGTAGPVPKPRPPCQVCGKPCSGLQNGYCSPSCAGQGRRRQPWPAVAIAYYTCRYCGEVGVTMANQRQPREVCPARECQLARLAANNLIARRGMTREQADAAVVAYRAEGDHRKMNTPEQMAADRKWAQTVTAVRRATMRASRQW